MANSQDVMRKLGGAVKWSALIEVVPRLINPVISIVLARLLEPSSFGLLSTALIAMALAQIFSDAGLARALIQTRESPERAANVVFWSNLAVAIITYALLFVAAPWVAEGFGSPASSVVLRVLGLQLVLGAFAAAHQALLSREMDFKRLFFVRLLSVLLPAGAAIPMAFMGAGVWALVASQLVGSVITLVSLWTMSHWRPSLDYDWTVARGLLGFSAWVLLEGLAAWFCTWGDNLIVGRVLGIQALGIYQVGWNLVVSLFALALNPLTPVLFPAFSRLQDDRNALQSVFSRSNRIICAIAAPAGAGLFLVGQPLARLLLGPKYPGVDLVVQWVGLMFGISWLVGINSELYRAMGRPDLNVKLSLVAVAYYLPVFLMAAPHGLEVFVVGRAGVALMAIPLHIYLAHRILGLSWWYLWHQGKSFFVSTGMMVLGVLVVRAMLPIHVIESPLAHTLVVATTGVAVYTSVLWSIDRTFILETLNLLRRASTAR